MPDTLETQPIADGPTTFAARRQAGSQGDADGRGSLGEESISSASPTCSDPTS